MSSLRPEFHLAQQIRRDKLRIQNSTSHHLHDLEHQGLSNRNGNNHNHNHNHMMMLGHEPLYPSQEMMNSSEPNMPHNHEYVPAFPHSSQTCLTNTHSLCLPNVLNNSAGNVVLTDAQSSSPTTTCGETMHYPPPSNSVLVYQNGLQDIILNKSAYSSNHHPLIMHQNAHGVSDPVLLHHPTYASAFDHNALHHHHHHHQGLSLSLSSNSQHAKHVEQEHSTGKSLVVHHQDHVGLLPAYRSGVGPLGPFTGYATILKGSRFLRPCQQLLDEYCSSQCGHGASKSCASVAEWVSREASGASTSADDDDAAAAAAGKGGCDHAGASSSMYDYGRGGDGGGAAAANFCLASSRPECQKNKAKLLYMQEEVSRRYKQYHQQMQMVVSSFESVAGLNSSTPYISVALKSVSRHFRGLKNAISDHLKLLCEALGEDSSMPNAGAGGKFDADMARLRCMEQSFQRNKSNMEFVEPPQHVWRPQRGLPERSVAILKAWLFEHFLHPYPTDTDKHMLATQTGLSRNQVSNWFINARVRVWKPMVEEIHMLETKGIAGPNQNSTKTEGTSASEGSSSHHDHQPHHNNKFGGAHASTMIPERQFNCLEMGSSSSLLAGENVLNNGEGLQWNQEKGSKMECQFTSGMDGSTLMHFMPFRRDALEIGGIGPVSLTLGLRHGVEGAQQQLQLQQEEQIRRHFGGHMIHDFVG